MEEREDGRLLRLRAEMRLPGLAWLEFHVEHERRGRRARCSASARPSRPHGLAGHLYWWAIAAFHGIVFGGMVRGITRAAEENEPARPA